MKWNKKKKRLKKSKNKKKEFKAFDKLDKGWSGWNLTSGMSCGNRLRISAAGIRGAKGVLSKPDLENEEEVKRFLNKQRSKYERVQD